MANEIVISPKIGLMRALAFSVLPIAAKTDNSYAPFQTKCDRKWEELVCMPDNPNMPLVVSVDFEPGRSKKDGSLVIETTLVIPDPEGSGRDVRVSARPYILVDGISGYLPYFKMLKVDAGDGKKLDKPMPTTHLCFVFKNRKSYYYRVLPLALGSVGPDGALTRWNKASLTSLANAPEANKAKVAEEWPVIEPFVHALHLDHRKHKLLLNFKPTGYTPVNDQDPKSDMTYGAKFGQKVIHRGGNTVLDVPSADQVNKNGKPCFEAHVFHIVQFTDNSIGVTWVGPLSAVKSMKRGALTFETYRINGFDALGLKMTSANPRTIHDVAAWYANGVLDQGNLLYAYALGRGEVFEGQPNLQTHNALRQIGKNAADQVQSELMVEKNDLVNKFTTANLPTLAEALVGKDIAEVWYRESGEDDVVAKWIGEQIGEEFLWDSWLHTRVRIEVLRMIASKDGVQPPERPKKEEPKTEVQVPTELSAPVEEAKVEEIVEVPLVGTPVEELALPVAAEKPKRAGGRKKKDASEAAAV